MIIYNYHYHHLITLRCTSSTYLLSTDPTDLSRGADSAVASLRSNVLGTAFTLIREGSVVSSRPSSSSGQSSSSSPLMSWGEGEGPELASILYRPNMLGIA